MTEHELENLSNPDTLAKLKEMDVLARKEHDVEKEELDNAIACLDIPNETTLKLSKLQVQTLQRQAGVLGISWETHLHNEINSKIFNQNIGAPLISAPTVISGMGAKKITGPSKLRK